MIKKTFDPEKIAELKEHSSSEGSYDSEDDLDSKDLSDLEEEVRQSLALKQGEG